MIVSKYLNNIISDHIMPINKIPHVLDSVLFKEAIDSMNEHKLGIVCVIDKKNILKGVFTDGDIRRKIIKIQKPFSALFVDDVLTHTNIKPLTIYENKKIIDGLKIMNKNKIWDLPVISKKNSLLGLLHMNNVLKKIIDSSFE